jgi:hypothetical protein
MIMFNCAYEAGSLYQEGLQKLDPRHKVGACNRSQGTNNLVIV